MSTYLELCQAVAHESGTIPSLTDPSTVLSQEGRLLRIVNWVNDAWNEVQTERNDWRWMEAEFSGSTIASTKNYTSSGFSIASRFGEWRRFYLNADALWSIYLTSDGQSTARNMTFLPFAEFYNQFLVGSYDTGYPIYYTIAPDDTVYLHPTPDAAYTVRGFYRKAPQSLSADDDTPEMPARFHDIIKWRALIQMGIYDEAFNQLQGWDLKQNRLYSELVSQQTPNIVMPGALA